MNNIDIQPDQFNKYENCTSPMEISQDYSKNPSGNKLNKYPQKKNNQPTIMNLTIGQHLINMKNNIFGIYKDLAAHNVNKSIFTKDNRLFYIGFFLIVIFILYLILLNLTCN